MIDCIWCANGTSLKKRKFFLSLLPLTSHIKELECGQGGRWVSSSSSYSHGSSQVPIGDLVWSEFCRLWLIIRVLPRNYKALHQGERIVKELIWDFKDMSWKLGIELVILVNYVFLLCPWKITVLLSWFPHSRKWGPCCCFLFFVSLAISFPMSFPGHEPPVIMYRHIV